MSFISELELLGFKGIKPEESNWIELFFEDCSIMNYNNGIKEITIDLRRKYNIKLSDAIIAATAIFLGMPLLSADSYFDKINELIFVLYQPDLI